MSANMYTVHTHLVKVAKQFSTFQCMVSAPHLDMCDPVAAVDEKQAFHSASVGKLVTAILVMKAIETQRCTLDTLISTVLPPSLLDHLFVFDNHDYRHEVTLYHLLSHTSGINDYFDSKALDGSKFIDKVLRQPNHLYTPEALIQYTQNHQKAVGKPGSKFHYSDTGYVLLGIFLALHYQMPLNTLIQTQITQPCRMKHTFLCFHDDRFDAKQLAPLWINGVEMSQYVSLSADYAGGGLHTTAHDLTRLLQGLVNGKLVSSSSLATMMTFNHTFRRGLGYGLGLMEFRPGDFFFLFKKLPRLIGHCGISGAHAWIDVASQQSIVLNVGNTRHMVKSFRLVLTLLNMIYVMYQRQLSAQK